MFLSWKKTWKYKKLIDGFLMGNKKLICATYINLMLNRENMHQHTVKTVTKKDKSINSKMVLID